MVKVYFFICKHCGSENRSSYHSSLNYDQGEVYAYMCETRCARKKKEKKLKFKEKKIKFKVIEGGKTDE